MGALGSSLGAYGAGIITGLVVVPGGVTFVSAVVAAAAIGYGMYTVGKWGGESLYDIVAETMKSWADAWVEIF